MTLAPYPEYRSSPLTPTGVAPKHWLDGAVKRGFRITLGKMVVASNENDDRTTQPYLRSANVQDGWLALDDVKEMYFSPTEAASLSLLEGDLVICEGGDVGRCALLRENLEGYGFQNSINRARGIGDNCTAYLAYWLSHLKNNGFIDVLCNRSTIAHYTAEKLANTPMLMPTPGEQSAIAAFLDQETGKIDALVAEQERLIALLKEKRQAVISQAVTKGLNPNAPMKDSGIEWLGQVPAHWDVTPLKFIATFSGGGTPSREIAEFWGGEIPWVSPKDMKYETISDSEEKITGVGLEESASSLIQSDAVLLVVRSGILRHTIPVAVNICPVALNQDMKAIRLDEKRCLPQFLKRLIQGMNEAFLNQWLKQGATVESIEHNYLAGTPIPLAGLEEQFNIISFLDHETQKIDTLITEATQAITLLRERRAALISAAVTGKIDVRSLAPTKQEAA